MKHEQAGEHDMGTLALDISALGGLSDEQLFRLCADNRDIRIERTSTGELILMSPTGGETGARSMRIGSRLFNWNEQTGLGLVFDSSTGFQLPNGAMRSADVAWVVRNRWEALRQEEREKFPPICPDFIIELRSKSDRLETLQEKMREGIDNGCRFAWLIDPVEESVHIYASEGSLSVIESFDEEISAEDLLPGFRLKLAELR
jgi:Uma2 family endonuclease